MADTIRINGNQYSYASVVLKIGGVPFYGLAGLTWSQKRERPMGYGAGRHRSPRGRTSGKYSAEAKLTLYRDAWSSLQAQLAALAADGVSFGDTEFQMVLQYVEDATNQAPVTVEFEQCAIAGEDSATEEGDDPDKVEIPLSVMRIRTNGLTLFNNASLAGSA